MEHTDRNGDSGLSRSPFTTAGRFGWALHYGNLPGWVYQLAHDGERTHGVWTDGRRFLSYPAGEA